MWRERNIELIIISEKKRKRKIYVKKSVICFLVLIWMSNYIVSR